MRPLVSGAVAAVVAATALGVGAIIARTEAIPDQVDGRLRPAAVLVSERTVLPYDAQVTQVVRVVDGDTLELRARIWPGLETTGRLRLLGVDTPERGEPGYAEATTFAASWLTGRPLTLLIQERPDSFGRWLGTVCDVPADVCLHEALFQAGLGI